ncbi:MAG: exonuclease SbcCD subunit D [Ruminococcaceae bacterium]|nr:exonuclease SbcCD subunit D [Oscillospiraceae bacterium]
MKLLHTSDLHLGLRLCENPMNEDIAHLLNEIIEIAETESCSAVIVAGDIYDRSNPGADSVAIFDRFVTELSRRGIALLAVSGNHDSPERVAYMSDILGSMGVHFSPVYSGKIEPITISDEFGNVHFWLLPFLRPSTIRGLHEDFTGESYTDAMRYVIERMNIDTVCRNVLVTHQFVVGSNTDDAENVGGIMAVDSSVFDKFSYTALGHLHTAHNAGRDNVRYCGSPLKCSFSEVDDTKTVDIVDIDKDGKLSVKEVPLHPLRDMREIRGSYDEVMSLEWRERVGQDDYLRIVLTDEEDVQDAVAKLRTAYPNLLRLTYDNKRTREYRSTDSVEREEMEALRPLDVFCELYELQYNDIPDEDMMQTVRRFFDEIRNEESI